MYKYAGVIINNQSLQVDRIFTYEIPENLIGKDILGYRVKVPFGKGNKNVDGFIIELYEDIEKTNGTLKFILKLSDKLPLISMEDISLIKQMKEAFFCSYIDCIKTIIPTGITKGVKDKTVELIFTGKSLEGKYLKDNYINIYNIISKNNGKYNKSKLSLNFGLSLSSIETLIKHGFLIKNQVQQNRYDQRQYDYYEEKVLNEDQNRVLNDIINSEDLIHLIHGITGSGKTEIYMNLVSKNIKEGKQCIVLVPEIALTPQMVERFKGRFGKDITVFHSKLSNGERFDEWMRVKKGEVKVAVGARSAIFLPFENLGLIIIDEEHEATYKSESDPKYTAMEIAIMKSKIYGCKVVLGSATPSISTYYKCEQGEIILHNLKSRADGAALPEVEIVDMREELEKNNKSIFSEKLYNQLENKLENKEQSILFLNRRGFSTFVSCRKCGYVFKCKKCDISLTYHSSNNTLTCHYCGSSYKALRQCPQCGSKYVKYFGIGTEKVEQEVKKYFNKSKTIRMDFDTTRKKYAYENIYNSFKKEEADILIGTQMIAKGLDFPNVTLVGVIAADLSLNLPDFRSNERTFQLITQVSGRAGRGKKSGKVIVQTYDPESYSIKFATQNDYEGFYKNEIKVREDMNYPPFSNILLINMTSKDEQLLIKSIQNVGINLKNQFKDNDKIDLLGPCPCVLSKIKEQYRWQIILKGKVDSNIAMKVKMTIYELLKDVYNNIRVSIDINPNSLL